MRAAIFVSLAGLAVLAVLAFELLSAAQVAGAGAAILIAVVAIAAALAIALSRPISRAGEFARSLSRGEAPPRLPETARSQIGELYRALNRIAEAYRSKVSELGSEKTETEVLLHEMGEGVLALNRAGDITRANSEMLAALGINGIEGRAVSAVFRNPQLINFLTPSQMPDEGVDSEFDVFGRAMRVSARKLPGGGAVAVFSDLSEIRRLDRVRTEFVANASHELKTPLTAIRGYAETLADDTMAEDRRRAFAQRIVEQAERMAAIVNDMLTLARLEDPTHVIRRESVPLFPLLREVEQGHKQRLESAGIDFVVDIDPSDIQVAGDPDGVRQILQNLIDNAIRHSEAARIAIQAKEAEAGSVRVVVTDDGRGIPSEHAGRIFERFYRADPSRSRATGGTGLGLSIVKHWAEVMGGRVGVESVLGQGTTVTVTFPAASTAVESH